MRPDRPPGARTRERPQVTTPGGHSPKHSTGTDEVRIRLQQHPGAAGELAAWGAAVEHLHRAGLAAVMQMIYGRRPKIICITAAVPAFPAAWLARRGIRADWVAAA